MFAPKVDASEGVRYGLNHYDKLYINEIGVMALSKGDILKIDGEYNDYYYTITTSGNVFFIPKHRIEPVDPANPLYTQEVINKKIDRQSKITSVVGFAYMQLGKPYKWGGAGTSAYDCSSLMQTSYNSLDIEIPRTSRTQAVFGKSVAAKDIQIGDLLFFKNSKGIISHVGMYIGEGEFVHASSSNNKVMISTIAKGYYSSHIVGAKRIIE